MFLLTAALFGIALMLAVASMAFTLRSAMPRIADVLAGQPRPPAIRLVEVRRLDPVATARRAAPMAGRCAPIAHPRQAALRAA